MNYDKYGQCYTTSNELCDLLYKNPELDLSLFMVADPADYNNSIKHLFVEFEKLSVDFGADV
jgi:hypothetical protein